MGIHQIDRIAVYVRYLQENPQEVELLFKELLIGVTSFFRDPAAWEQLQGEVHSGAAGEPTGRRGAAGLVGRLLDRRGGLFAGHGLQGGAGSGQANGRISRCRSSPPTWTGTPSTRPARGSTRPTSPPTCPPSGCSGSFVQEGAGYRVGKEIREMVTFATAERHHGSALYQAGYPHLPQPADLPDPGTAEKAPAALSLQPESRRRPVSGQRREPAAPSPISSRRCTSSHGSSAVGIGPGRRTFHLSGGACLPLAGCCPRS